MGGHSGNDHPDDERSVVGKRVSGCAVICGDEFAIAITQSAYAAGSAYGAFIRDGVFKLSIWLAGSAGVMRALPEPARTGASLIAARWNFHA